MSNRRCILWWIVACVVAVTMPVWGTGTKEVKAPAEKVKTILKVYSASNINEFSKGLDENHNFIADYLDEKTGYDIVWSIQPPSGVREKLSMMMASGDAPDLIQLFQERSVFGDFAQQGVLASLGEALQSAGGAIRKVVPEQTWKVVTYQGKIQGIPVPQAAVNSTGLLTRNDWLKSLGLKQPKNLQDFHDVLKAIKTANPGENGTIPYVAGAGAGKALNNLAALSGAFGLAVPYAQRGGSIVYTYVQPEAKNFLQYMNALYTEGLLDQEYPVNKDENITEKLVTERAAMTTTTCWISKAIIETVAKKNPKSEFVFMDLPVGDNGQSGFAQVPPVNWIWIIPVFSKHTKEAVDLINKYVQDPEINRFVSFGIQGTHYNIVNDVVVPTPEASNILWQVYYNLWADRDAHFQRAKFKGYWPYYQAVFNYPVIPNALDYAPPLPAVEKSSATLNDLMNEYYIKIIAGALPIDKFDEYVQKWEASGGKEAVNAINEWWAKAK
jgi:putative aldouronate transport system substrate-binding protein